MINFAEIAKIAVEAAENDWRVSAGLVAAGVICGFAHAIWQKHKDRKERNK